METSPHDSAPDNDHEQIGHPDIQTEDPLLVARAANAPEEFRDAYYTALHIVAVHRERAQSTPWNEDVVNAYRTAVDGLRQFETDNHIGPPELT